MRYVMFVMLAACTPSWQAAVARGTEAGTVASLACDGGTTMQFLHSGTTLYEKNPVLGEHPSDAYVWTYLAAIGAAVVIGNRLVSNRVAMVINSVVLAVETESIGVNMHVGSSLCGVGSPGPWRAPMDVAR